jgi:hypothetical protein
VRNTASGLESAAGDAALPNDGLKCSDSDFRMVRNRYGHGARRASPLHDEMTASLSDNLKAVLFEDATDVSSGKDAELTHAPLRSG